MEALTPEDEVTSRAGPDLLERRPMLAAARLETEHRLGR